MFAAGLSQSRTGNRAGFTLFEIFIAVTIMGVMTAVAVPKLRQLWDARQAAGAADTFVRDHELARITAVRFGRDSHMHVDTLTPAFWVDVDTNGSGVRATLGTKHSFASVGLKMTSTDTLICFDMRGLLSTQGVCQGGAATVTFKSLNIVDTIQITSLGKILR